MGQRDARLMRETRALRGSRHVPKARLGACWQTRLCVRDCHQRPRQDRDSRCMDGRFLMAAPGFPAPQGQTPVWYDWLRWVDRSIRALLAGGGGGGVTDHGALTGLGDDDHPQYHTDARGDARYSLLGHTHPYSPIAHVHTPSAQTLTMASAAYELSQTVAVVGVTAASRITTWLAPANDSDENDPEMLDLVTTWATPGTDAITFGMTFDTLTSGNVK